MVLTRQACFIQEALSNNENHVTEMYLAGTKDKSNVRSLPLGPSQMRSKPLHLLDLPQEMLERIFYWLSYKNIAQIRPVCHLFDRIASHLLTSCFRKLQTQILVRFKEIKAQMPRRDSARRKHPLARESDIIETLHMRLSLLHMTFGKHMERYHICFFPGEILDEAYRILHYIRTTPTLGVAFKVTDELFDLSSMAMEYFRERIEPRLPEINAFFTPDFLDFNATTFDGTSSSLLPLSSSNSSEISSRSPISESLDKPLPPSNMVLRKRIRRIRQGMKKYSTQLASLRRELKACKGTVADQHRQIREYSTRLDEYDRKFDESSRKYSTLLQELNKCKTELQYWRSKSPAVQLSCNSCGARLGVPSDELQMLAHQGVMVDQIIPSTSEIAHARKNLFADDQEISKPQKHATEDHCTSNRSKRIRI